MNHDSALSDVEELSNLYNEIQKKMSVFKLATGIRCLPGCGQCCENPKVEATVPEMYSLAREIFREKKEDEIIAAIEAKTGQGDSSCVLYQPDQDIPGNGRCGQYPHRALVCRLFGFSARKNRLGQKEFSTCRKIKERYPELIENAQKLAASGTEIPVYQDSFYRLASVFPDRGFSSMPINQAILRALEQVWWKKPDDVKYAEAS